MSNILTMEITTPDGGKLSALLFNNGFSRSTAAAIVEGKAYPAISFIKDVRTVVDVGANVGIASLWFSLLYPDSRVFAIEPSPEAFALLKENARHRPNIKPFNIGLHRIRTAAHLHRGVVDSSTGSIGNSVLNREDSVPIELVPAEEFLRSNDVTAIDILKLDTEGCERPILESIKERIPDIRVIHIEYHSEADRVWIENLLLPSHVLVGGVIEHRHRGIFRYVARNAYPSEKHADRFEISMPDYGVGMR